eukprot:1200546-Rhodomonas_salina.2
MLQSQYYSVYQAISVLQRVPDHVIACRTHVGFVVFDFGSPFEAPSATSAAPRSRTSSCASETDPPATSLAPRATALGFSSGRMARDFRRMGAEEKSEHKPT